MWIIIYIVFQNPYKIGKMNISNKMTKLLAIEEE